MILVDSTRAWLKKQQYLPAPPLGLLVNPVYIVRRGLYKAFAEYAPRLSGRVMDFGAGASPYRSLFSGVTGYVTVDIADGGHPRSNKTAAFYYDGRTLPFEDASFEGIFSSEVFEHVFNLHEILEEIHRVLKPGGLLLFSCPFVWDEHEIPYDFARYTSHGLIFLLDRYGFDVVRHRKTSGYLEAAFALITAYIQELRVFTPWPLRQIAKLLLVFPLNTLGVVLGAILPKNDRLYTNNVFLCRRRS